MSQEPTSAAAPRRRGRSRRKHAVGQVLLVSLVVLALVTALSVVFLYRHLNGNLTVSDAFDEVDNAPEEVVSGPQKPMNVLVMGSDTREGEGNQIDGEGGAGSDTTILFHLSADRTRAYGVSIPRDSLVTRPDCGADNEIPGGENVMWNEAFGLGEEACTIEQFQEATGVRVHHFVVVDFNGFKDMVDAIGGVDVCIPRDFEDPAHNIHIEAGDRVLKGDEALSYVRVRYNIGDGSDLGRIKRQQAFIASMVNKVVSAGTLANPARVVSFLNAATKSLTVDEGLQNVTKIAQLALEFQDIGLGNIQFVTVPNGYYPSDSEFRGRVFWKQPDAKRLWKKIAADKPLTSRLTDGAISAQQPPGSESPSPTAQPSKTGSDSPSPSETESSETESPSETASPGETESPSGPASPSASPTSTLSAEEAEQLGLCA